MKNEVSSKYTVQKQIRITSQMEKLIRAKALEHNATDSEIMRQALVNYINRSMSDTEIVHASLVENSKKIRYLEKKVELLALIIFEQSKLIMRMFPEKQINSEQMVQKSFDSFMKNCTEVLRKNHQGVLESMILDSYERQESDEKGEK